MIGKTTIGRTFGGCVAYQFQKLEQQQGQLLLSRGVRDYKAEVMTQDFEQQRRLNPALKRAVWHTAISFPPEERERLTNDKMAAIALDYLEGMGLARGQYAVIRHDDRPHPHFHLVANRVADNGQTVSDGLNYARSEKLLRRLEQKYGLTPVISQGARRSLHNVPEYDQKRLQLRETVQAGARAAQDLAELTQVLGAKGITVHQYHAAAVQVTDLSFEQDGQRFKGSQLARSLSLGGIMKLLAQPQTLHNAQQVTAPAQTIGLGGGR